MATVTRRRLQRHTVALRWLAHPALLFERVPGPGLLSLVTQPEARNSSSANDFAQSVRGVPYEAELSRVGLVNVISPKWRVDRPSCSRTYRRRDALFEFAYSALSEHAGFGMDAPFPIARNGEQSKVAGA